MNNINPAAPNQIPHSRDGASPLREVANTSTRNDYSVNAEALNFFNERSVFQK